jgi:hypothetical protein
MSFDRIVIGLEFQSEIVETVSFLRDLGIDESGLTARNIPDQDLHRASSSSGMSECDVRFGSRQHLRQAVEASVIE